MTSCGIVIIKAMLLVIISEYAHAQNACEVCSCQPDPQAPLAILCQNDNLTAIPVNISSGIKLLQVKGKVEQILATDLQGLSQLTSFEIKNNNLSVIESGAFRDLTSLQTLSLSNNSVSQLSSSTLTGLGNLTHLYMENNNVAALPDSICAVLTSIQYLNARGNKIQSIGSDVFTACGSLSHIDISENQMMTIAQDAFDGLDSLSTLYLSGNGLTTFYSAWLTNKTSSFDLAIDNSGWHCTTQMKVEYQNMNQSHPSIIGCASVGNFCPLCENFGGRRLENLTMDELVVTTTTAPTTNTMTANNSTGGNVVVTGTVTGTTNSMTTSGSDAASTGNIYLTILLLATFFAATMSQ